MASRYRKSDIRSLSKREIFFDANVIIYVHWQTHPNNKETKNYSYILKELLEKKNKLKINISVISEVVNRIMKLEYDRKDSNYKQIYTHFKKFRDSKEGKNTLKDIYNIIKNKILPKFEIVNKDFSKSDIESMLNNDNLDFNDKIIFKICKENNFILITNDSDFSNVDIDILSCNNKLK